MLQFGDIELSTTSGASSQVNNIFKIAILLFAKYLSDLMAGSLWMHDSITTLSYIILSYVIVSQLSLAISWVLRRVLLCVAAVREILFVFQNREEH